jgi:hypothetical protein
MRVRVRVRLVVNTVTADEAGSKEGVIATIATAGGDEARVIENKRNLKTPVKTRTLHLSEPYDSRSTPHTAMQPRKE